MASAIHGTIRLAWTMLWILAAFSSCCVPAEAGSAGAAQRGWLDLSSLDLQAQTHVHLDGEWERYCGRLLSPEDFHLASPPAIDEYITLPTGWNACEAPGQPEDREFRHATLRLQVTPPPDSQPLALWLCNIRSAFALWVNGQPLAASGRPGDSLATESPRPDVILVEFLSTGQPLELVLQVSNHHHQEGGVPISVLLGTPRSLEFMQIRHWAVAAFFAGGLLLMGVYHLVLAALRRTDSSLVLFGLYCLLWLGNYACSESGYWIVRLAFPEAGSLLTDRLALVLFFCSVPVGYRFFLTLYPDEFPRLLGLIAGLWGLLFMLLAAVAPLQWVTTLVPLYYASSSALILFSLWRLAAARRHRREGAGFILAGFGILGAIGLNDMLFDTGLIPTMPLIHVGMFGFILCQSFALARRFSRAFTAVEQLSVALEGKNVILEAEMAERARLMREIVDATETERRRLSHDLHDGLCQQLTGARLRCTVLERAEPGTGDLAALSTLLQESVSQAYTLSMGLWPVEHGPASGGPSLEELARRVSEASGVEVRVSTRLACQECLHEQLVQLYRIAQEALTNAIKHARPKVVEIHLACDGETLALRVQDDGIGRGAAQAANGRTDGGLGMRIMSHRAALAGGALHVEDITPTGTRVWCSTHCAAGPRSHA